MAIVCVLSAKYRQQATVVDQPNVSVKQSNPTLSIVHIFCPVSSPLSSDIYTSKHKICTNILTAPDICYLDCMLYGIYFKTADKNPSTYKQMHRPWSFYPHVVCTQICY